LKSNLVGGKFRRDRRFEAERRNGKIRVKRGGPKSGVEPTGKKQQKL